MDQPEHEKTLGVMAAAVFFCCMTATALGQQQNEPGKSAATTNSVSIHSLLDQKMPHLEFWGNPFEDVVKFFCRKTGANIEVNWASLEKAGIKKDAPITFQLKGTKFCTVLNIILDNADDGKGTLDYIVENGQIIISASDKSHQSRHASTMPTDPALLAMLDHVMPNVRPADSELGEAVNFLRNATGANIFVNWNAMEKAGIKEETPVTFNLKDVKFSEVLDAVVRSASSADVMVSYVLDDNVIVISATRSRH